MNHVLRIVLVAAVLIAAPGIAASQQSTQQPGAPAQPPSTTVPAPDPAAPGQQPVPPVTTPGAQTPAVPGQVAVPPVPATPAALASRAFTGACGLLMHPVRPERVPDFEQFLDYVRDAIAKSTNPRVRGQAEGWRFLKATEAGPNGVALYVFLVDPAVPGAEYALGPILAEVYTDPAQLAEIWALYTGAVTSGGTLLNLTEVAQRPPQPIASPAANPPLAGQKPGAGVTTATTTPPVSTTPPAPTTPAAPAVTTQPRC